MASTLSAATRTGQRTCGRDSSPFPSKEEEAAAIGAELLIHEAVAEGRMYPAEVPQILADRLANRMAALSSTNDKMTL